MKWPFVSRRYHDDQIMFLRADRDRLRGERDQFKQDRDAAQAASRTVARQYTDLDEKYTAVSIVNTRLTEDLAAARADASDSLAGQLRAELKREKRRADQLQKQYDNAVGLTGARPVDSSSWQPGYQDPKQATA